MIMHTKIPTVREIRAMHIGYTLACLQAGVRRARAEAKAKKLEANLAARWQG